jgi:hypothetical protein
MLDSCQGGVAGKQAADTDILEMGGRGRGTGKDRPNVVKFTWNVKTQYDLMSSKQTWPGERCVHR